MLGTHKTVLDNQLPAPSRNDLSNYNLKPEVEGAPPVAGARPLTFAEKMTRDEARSAVLAQLEELDLSGPFVITDDTTEDRDSCYVFYWTLESALNGGSPLAGNGPYIVDRHSGRVFSTGTALPITDFITAFEKFGTPAAALGQTSCVVTITGWREGAQKISATKRLRSTGRFTLGPAKHAVDSVLDGESVTIAGLDPKCAAARNLLLEGDPWSSRGAGPEGGEMGVDRHQNAK